MKIYNKKGSVLQIVLIIFLSMTFFLQIYINNIASKYQLYKNILIMEKQKNYEILLCHYFKNIMRDDLLLSENIEVYGYDFSFDVDVDYYSYVITVTSDHPYFNYIFKCSIDTDSYQVLKIEYLKED